MIRRGGQLSTIAVASCLLVATVLAQANSQDCAAADQLVQSVPASASAAQQEAIFLRALTLCPGHPAALNNLGNAYEQAGRLDDALHSYFGAAQAFSRAKASPAVAFFGAADVYRKMNRNEDALYWYRKGLEFEPGNAESRQAVTELTVNDPPALTGSRSIAEALGSRDLVLKKSVSIEEQVLPFALNSANLLPEARPQLREIAYAVYDRLDAGANLGVLSPGPVVAEIVGHADRRGTAEYNQALARRRAEAVVSALVSQFRIPATRLRAVSMGATDPRCSDDTEACHARNRRVEIRKP